MSKKVIQLIRVSTEGQAGDDRAGIQAQRETNGRTARAYGLEVVKTIEILDVSGSAVLRSPEMQQLLDLIKSPEISGVLAKEFSRLMRPDNFADYVLLQHFIETKTILYLPDGPLDLASKQGKLLGAIRAAMAGLECADIVERTQAAKEAMRRAGKHPGGRATLPYAVGYSKDRGWYYKEEAAKVRRVFDLFLGGQTCYETIAGELGLSRTNLQFLLQNPIYTGWKVYDKKRDPSPEAYIPGPNGRQGYRKKIRRSPEEVIRVKVLEDPLVSEEEFARVQEIMEGKARNRRRARRDNPNRFTYSGFLTCGDCAELIYTWSASTSGDKDFYICKSHHVREKRKRAIRGLEPCANRCMLRKKLEPKIDGVLSGTLCDQNFLERVIAEYNEELRRHAPAAPVDQSTLVARIKALQEKRRRILDTFFDSMITKSERDQRVEEVEREISVYNRLAQQFASEPQGPALLDLDAVLALIQPFAEWEFLGRDDRRALLQILCPEISVTCYEIKHLRLNVDPETNGRNKDSRPKTVW